MLGEYLGSHGVFGWRRRRHRAPRPPHGVLDARARTELVERNGNRGGGAWHPWVSKLEHANDQDVLRGAGDMRDYGHGDSNRSPVRRHFWQGVCVWTPLLIALPRYFRDTLGEPRCVAGSAVKPPIVPCCSLSWQDRQPLGHNCHACMHVVRHAPLICFILVSKWTSDSMLRCPNSRCRRGVGLHGHNMHRTPTGLPLLAGFHTPATRRPSCLPPIS